MFLKFEILLSKLITQLDREMEVSEARTRKELIDPQLRESGWDVSNPSKILCEIDTKQSDFEKRDYKTFEDTFANNQHKAYADYLLLDSKGDPLAIIEAKKTSKDPRLGQEQASQYAQDIKDQNGSDVFILLTNGEEIWYWNKGHEGPRPIKAFPTRDDLETRRYHNISKKSFSDVEVNREIITRPYQKEAVKRVLEGIENGRRKFLIVQATGTGKTRVAMAICDILLRAQRVKRILFLADRIELRDQALNDNFAIFLPDHSATPVYSESVDTDKRIYVSTIQTFENIYQKFSVGFFDLIISDEAHRSIYNKWKDVFTYFDALQVGLTATPTDIIDRDTFQFFDCFDGNPTVNYSIDEAIAEGYLCGYWIHNTSTKFQLEGITPKDIPEEEKERLLSEGIDPEEIQAEGSALERSIIVEDTNMEIIREFMNYCITDDSGLPAKTIIFPFNINHGRRIQQIFEKLYPEHKGELVQLISSDDSRAKSLIKKFKTKSLPRIAISVGILDTGVDIPEICNLVFMRQTFSKIRFWQMIGRGTRSDEACKYREWLPNGKKEEFVIFDAWENFDYFKEHPRGKEVRPVTALSTKIFLIRLEQYQIFQESKDLEHLEQVRKKIIDDIKSLPMDSISVKEKKTTIDTILQEKFWNTMGRNPIEYLKKEIAPIMKFKSNINQNEAQFTLKCEQFVLATLKEDKKMIEDCTNLITKYALSIPRNLPDTKPKVPILDMVTDHDFWKTAGIDEIIEVRDRLAPIMEYKQPEPIQKIVLNLDDYIKKREKITYGPSGNEEFVDTYRAKVERKIKDLADATAVIRKIKENKPLTETDLEDLEKTLNSPDLFITEENLRMIYEKHRGTLVQFIKKILGLYEFPNPEDRIKEAFKTFVIEKNYFNANQVNFMRILQSVFLKNRHIEFNDLFEPPFTNLGTNAPIPMFKKEEISDMLEFCKKLEVEVKFL